MVDKVLQARLKKIGIFVSSYGHVKGRKELPYFTIDSESEVPDEEELEFLEEGVPRHITARYPDITPGRSCPGVNMITLRKREGLWTYRRFHWQDKGQWRPSEGDYRGIPLPMLFSLL